MARKKRQYLQPEQAQEPVSAMLPSVWETAIYARLSVENSKKNDDGDSIEGQIEICRDYVSEHPYLHLADTYVDNGWTGTNTDRPEFQRLLSDIREGKIKALVIKDFSRFSRDYIEAGNLLENIFPAMGVRFISVVDRYDSFETDGSASSLLIPLKNLINSFYSRDQSKKVSLAVHAKQLAGEHIPSMIPYGYRKSTTQEYRFEPDPETAPIVRRIYAQFLSGIGARPIMRQLNEEGIPSPGRLRYLRGQTKRACYSDCLWTQQVIKQILMNPTYMGDLVFGRMPTALYLGQPDYHYEPDESKWRIAVATSIRSEKSWRQVAVRMRPSWKPAGITAKSIRRSSKAESSGAGTAVPISVTADTARKRKVGTTAGTSSMAAAMLPSASRRKSSRRLSGTRFRYSLPCSRILRKWPGG